METAPNDAIEAQIELCDDILSFLNTLEVTEVVKITQHDIKIHINNKAQKGEEV